MLYKGVATCYLNLLVISSCCFDTNSEMFPMIHLYQIAQLTTNGHYSQGRSGLPCEFDADLW